MPTESANSVQHSSKRQARQSQSERILFVGARMSLVAGLLAAGVALGGQFLVGQVYSGAEARSLLQAFVPSARAVGAAVVGASATILALMLTMLSLTRRASGELEGVFFRRVERIGLLSTLALAGGILLLLLLSIPLDQSKNLPGEWFSYVYYTLIAVTATLAGILVAIVLMLYNAIQSLIEVISPSASSANVGAPKGSQSESGGSESGT